MQIIFCANPLAPRAVDDAYTDEAQAAMASGLEYHLISYERLVHERDAGAAVRRVPAAAAPELAIYRGWMLEPHHEPTPPLRALSPSRDGGHQQAA